jgi:diguanylate cyclase (GGDEF)-like protein
MLDMRTIVFITMIFNFIFGIGMLIGTKYRKSFAGVDSIGYGFLLTGIGFLLMYLRDYIDPFFSVVICNTLILIGVILTYRGLMKLYQKTNYSFLFDAGFAILFFIIFTYYLQIDNNVNMRIIVICIYLLFYYSASLYAVVYKPFYTSVTPNWFIGSIHVVAIGYYIFRLLFTINESKIGNFMDAGLVHSVAILIFALWSVVICFGVFIVMNTYTNEKLEKNAYFDSLTNLYNRRALTELLGDSIIGGRYVNVTALVLCDVDNFKYINDTYGHLAGDFVLKEISLIISEMTRHADFVCRFGGDEFFVFLEVEKEKDIQMICEKIRLAVSKNVFSYHHHEIKTSLSFGVHATFSEKLTIEERIHLADQLLYKAKENGRNRVEIDFS